MKKNFVKNLVAVGVMTVLSVGIIAGIRISQGIKGETIEAISLGSYSGTDITINEAGQVLNEEGAVEAFVVTVSAKGFSETDPMVFKLRFDQTATTLLNYEVVEHNETPTLGGKFAKEDFVAKLAGVTAPVYIEGQEEVGTKIDGTTGATISAEAMVKAINGAQQFLRKEVLKLETVEPIAIGDFTSEGATIVEAGTVVADNGDAEAFVVTVSSIGYTQTEPMVFKLRFDLSGDTLLKYELVEHNETPTLGGKAAAEEFATALTGIKAPVYIEGQEEVGTKIDGITGATLSSEAVVRAINTAQEFLKSGVVTLETIEAIAVDGFTSEDATIEEAGKVIGENGETEAYVVTVSSAGFSPEPIVLKLKFDATGTTLLQYKVVSQNETPTLGGKIQEEAFITSLTGITAPVYVEGQDETGTKVDGITGATISTEAVVRCINSAYEFLQSSVLN